jgi:hypothetical protein
MRAKNTKFDKKRNITSPADTHEETNRQAGVVRKVANKIVQRECGIFGLNVTMFSISEMHRSLFHPLATVRHRI